MTLTSLGTSLGTSFGTSLSRVAASAFLVIGLIGVAPHRVGADPHAEVALAAAPASLTAADAESRFLTLIDELRVSVGLGPLVRHPELDAAAQRWTDVMAGDGDLRHAADLAEGLTVDWMAVGENVGVHWVHDVDALFQAFVDSPGHYANLVDPQYTHVGVGVTFGADGRIWTTHRFMALRPAAAPPAAAPPVAAPPAAGPGDAPAPAPVAGPTDPPVEDAWLDLLDWYLALFSWLRELVLAGPTAG